MITLAAALQNGYSPNDTVDGTDPVLGASKFPAPEAFTINSDGDEDGLDLDRRA